MTLRLILNQFFSTIGENHASNQEENVNPLSYICRVTPVIDVDFPVEAFSRKLKSVNPRKHMVLTAGQQKK